MAEGGATSAIAARTIEITLPATPDTTPQPPCAARRSLPRALLRIALLALGAEAPEGHLGLVDHEALRLGRVEAGRRAGHAGYVLHLAARSADDVVVVVGHARLVQGGGASGRLDATHQTELREHPQGVVHGLARDVPEPLAHARGESVGVEVARPVQLRVDRQPRRGDAHSCRAQAVGGGDLGGCGRHIAQVTPGRLRRRSPGVWPWYPNRGGAMDEETPSEQRGGT